MGLPVKLSNELVDLAREEAAVSERSLTGQIEHWARIGQSVESVLRCGDVRRLKYAAADEPVQESMRGIIQDAIRVAATDARRPALARRLKADRVVYQSGPAESGLLERIMPDGTRTLGRLVGRRFVPERSRKSRA